MDLPPVPKRVFCKRTCCRDCYGCPHGYLKMHCTVCSDCGHRRIKKDCRICSSCPHEKLKRNCEACRFSKKTGSKEYVPVPLSVAPTLFYHPSVSDFRVKGQLR